MRILPALSRCLPLACAVALAGCASTGQLESTAVPRDPASLAASQSLAGVHTDTRAWPRLGWWHVLGDAQLDQLVDQALADSPGLAIADARTQAALAAAGAADAARLPTLNGGASVAGARLPPMLPPLASGHFGVIRYGYLSFSWDLDAWGGQRAAWQAAVGSARAAAIDARAARLKLAASVVQAYFDLSAAHTTQALAGAELQRAQDFLDLTRQRVASGIDNQLSLHQLEGEVAADQARLEAAANGVRTDQRVLAALLGAGPDRGLAIQPAALPRVPELHLPSKLPAELLGRRPDVLAARWRVEAAGAAIDAAKAKFLPNLDISALAGLIAPSALDFFSLGNRFYSIAPAISLPIFEGGALRANLAGKDAARDLAVASYNRALVHAIHEVADEIDALQSLELQRQAASAARTSAGSAYDLAMQRYRAGVGSFLEALAVREQLIGAERHLAELEAAQCKAWAMLNLSLGGGFEAPATAPARAIAQLVLPTHEHADARPER